MKNEIYTVYGIIDNRQFLQDGTKNENYLHICYIGQTKRKLHIRLYKHFVSHRSPFYNLHKIYGRDSFIIYKIREVNNKRLALDLENKYIKQEKKVHTLLNTIHTISKKNISKKKDKNYACTPIRCINTGEILTITDACNKYDIVPVELVTKCGYNENIGIDEDENPLFWEFVDGHKIPRSKKEFQVYSIRYNKQKIDITDIIGKNINKVDNINNWKPIYIGSTTQKLSVRFSSHKSVGYTNKELHNFLKEHENDYTFCIFLEALTCNKEEMLAKEKELTENYRKDYKLFNLLTGTKLSKNHSKKIAQGVKEYWENISDKDRQLHAERVKEAASKSIPVICITNGKEYLSALDAAKDLNIEVRHIRNVLAKGTNKYDGYEFKYANNTSEKFAYHPLVYKLYIVYFKDKPWYIGMKHCKDNIIPQIPTLKHANHYLSSLYEHCKELLSVKVIESSNDEKYIRKQYKKLIQQFRNNNIPIINQINHTHEYKELMARNNIYGQKPCICLETCKLYSSLTEAGKELNEASGRIAIACSTGNPVKKLHFMFLDESIKQAHAVYQICLLSNNDKYIDVVACKFRNDKPPTFGRLKSYCNLVNKDTKVKVLERLEENEKHLIAIKVNEYLQKFNIDKKKKVKQYRKIYCLTNRKTYNSIAEACRELNLNKSKVIYSCKTGGSTKGYKFEYID